MDSRDQSYNDFGQTVTTPIIAAANQALGRDLVRLLRDLARNRREPPTQIAASAQAGRYLAMFRATRLTGSRSGNSGGGLRDGATPRSRSPPAGFQVR